MRFEIGLSLSVLVSSAALPGALATGCAGSQNNSADVAPDASGTPSAAPGPADAPSANASASATAAPAASTGVVASASPSASAVPAAPPAPLPAGTKILVIGDSFAEALGAGLKQIEKDAGVKAVLRGQKATFIPEWAGPNKGVAGMLIQEKPDLVVIALGGNELAMTTPDIRGPKVKELVALLGSTPCVWVTPPLWGNKDNGLLEVIRKNSGPCRYFDSNVLAPDLPRGGDKIHPTVEGQRKWAAQFLDWLRRERDAKSDKLALLARPASE